MYGKTALRGIREATVTMMWLCSEVIYMVKQHFGELEK